MKNSWYRIQAKDNEAEVLIYDEIGFFGVSAKDFINDFQKISPDATINLRINSPGGEVFDGLAIFNLIRAHKGEVITTIDGLAASMASAIALAGNKVIMPENAYMMIHNPWGIAIGDAQDMADMADFLEKLNGTLANIYVKKSGKEQDEIRNLMDQETWLTAAEAKDLGLADEVSEAKKLAARANWKSKFQKLPIPVEEISPESQVLSPESALSTQRSALSTEEIRAQAEAQAEARAKEIVTLCTAAGIPDGAASFLERGFKVEDVKARLADADQIRARCLAAKLPERANAYIKAGMTVSEVANELFDTLIARQGEEIDNKLHPSNERRRAVSAPVVDIAEIYRKRNLRK